MRTPDDVVTVCGMDIALIADGRITRFWVFLELPSRCQCVEPLRRRSRGLGSITYTRWTIRGVIGTAIA
ncbi:MAG: hypothetical protein JWO14_547 [Solirubrobacterales bacterium]|nr:hypothetical protein [Solirubrobacterales bacterium]